MAKVTIKFSETTREQRREILEQLRRDTNPVESLKMVIDDLLRMEAHYGMSTVQFYAQFVAGKMGDCRDFIRWSGYFLAYQNLLEENFEYVRMYKTGATPAKAKPQPTKRAGSK